MDEYRRIRIEGAGGLVERIVLERSLGKDFRPARHSEARIDGRRVPAQARGLRGVSDDSGTLGGGTPVGMFLAPFHACDSDLREPGSPS